MFQLILVVVGLLGLFIRSADATVLHFSDGSSRQAAICEQTETAVLAQLGETWEVFPRAELDRIEGSCEPAATEPESVPQASVPPAAPPPAAPAVPWSRWSLWLRRPRPPR